MQDNIFNTLLNQYRSGNLIPIIGDRLLKINTLDNRKLSLEEYIIENITMSKYDSKRSPKNLDALTLDHPNLSLDDNDIVGIYNNILPHQFDTTLLKLLALPKGFGFYILTSHDRKLEELLSARCEAIVWNHEKKDPLYLDIDSNLKKIVYLFGCIKRTYEPYESFSFTDEDRMEALFSLSQTGNIPGRVNKMQYSFLEFLRGKTLLFIGNSFDDWLMRFMIRTLHNKPYHNNPNKTYIINNNVRNDDYYDYYFKKYKIKIIHQYPIEKFVSEFFKVIQDSEAFVDRFNNKKVFISYDRRNTNDAMSIYSQLRRKGINAWLDTRNLQLGEFDPVIREEIQSPKTCIFLCVLSRTLFETPTTESYVKDVEWRSAENRYRFNDISRRNGQKVEEFTILPVAVDDAEEYCSDLPEFIRVNNIYNLNGESLYEDIEKYMD